MTLNAGDISTEIFCLGYATKVSNIRFRVQPEAMKRLETEKEKIKLKKSFSMTDEERGEEAAVVFSSRLK